jgi:hypothetical protein
METSTKTITVRHSTPLSQSLSDILALVATKKKNESNPNNKSSKSTTKGKTGCSAKTGHVIDDSLKVIDSMSLIYCAATVTTETFFSHFKGLSLSSNVETKGKINTNKAVIKLKRGITVNFHTRENNFSISGKTKQRTLPVASVFCLIGLINFKKLYKAAQTSLATLFSYWKEIEDYLPTIMRNDNKGSKIFSRNGIPQDILMNIVSTIFKGNKDGKKIIFPGGFSFTFVGRKENTVISDGSYASDCLAILTITLALSDSILSYKQNPLHSATSNNVDTQFDEEETDYETEEFSDNDLDHDTKNQIIKAATAAARTNEEERNSDQSDDDDTLTNYLSVEEASPEKIVIRRQSLTKTSLKNLIKSKSLTNLQEVTNKMTTVEPASNTTPAEGEIQVADRGTLNTIKTIQKALNTLTRNATPLNKNTITQHLISMLQELPTTNFKQTWSKYKTLHPNLETQMKKNLCVQLKIINEATLKNTSTSTETLSNSLLQKLLGLSLQNIGNLADEIEDLRKNQDRAFAVAATKQQKQMQDFEDTITALSSEVKRLARMHTDFINKVNRITDSQETSNSNLKEKLLNERIESLELEVSSHAFAMTNNKETFGIIVGNAIANSERKFRNTVLTIVSSNVKNIVEAKLEQSKAAILDEIANGAPSATTNKRKRNVGVTETDLEHSPSTSSSSSSSSSKKTSVKVERNQNPNNHFLNIIEQAAKQPYRSEPLPGSFDDNKDDLTFDMYTILKPSKTTRQGKVLFYEGRHPLISCHSEQNPVRSAAGRLVKFLDDNNVAKDEDILKQVGTLIGNLFIHQHYGTF